MSENKIKTVNEIIIKHTGRRPTFGMEDAFKEREKLLLGELSKEIKEKINGVVAYGGNDFDQPYCEIDTNQISSITSEFIKKHCL